MEGSDGNVRSGEAAYADGVQQKDQMKENGRGLKAEAVDQAQRWVFLLFKL